MEVDVLTHRKNHNKHNMIHHNKAYKQDVFDRATSLVDYTSSSVESPAGSTRQCAFRVVPLLTTRAVELTEIRIVSKHSKNVIMTRAGKKGPGNGGKRPRGS